MSDFTELKLAGAPSAPPNYRAMTICDMLQALGDDAQKWADALLQAYPNCNIPHEIIMPWFANAMQHSSDVRRWRLIHDDAAWLGFQDDVFLQRRQGDGADQ